MIEGKNSINDLIQKYSKALNVYGNGYILKTISKKKYIFKNIKKHWMYLVVDIYLKLYPKKNPSEDIYPKRAIKKK